MKGQGEDGQQEQGKNWRTFSAYTVQEERELAENGVLPDGRARAWARLTALLVGGASTPAAGTPADALLWPG